MSDDCSRGEKDPKRMINCDVTGGTDELPRRNERTEKTLLGPHKNCQSVQEELIRQRDELGERGTGIEHVKRRIHSDGRPSRQGSDYRRSLKTAP